MAGLLIAEILFALNKRINAYQYVQCFFDRIHLKIGFISKEKTIE